MDKGLVLLFSQAGMMKWRKDRRTTSAGQTEGRRKRTEKGGKRAKAGAASVTEQTDGALGSSHHL